MENNSTLYHHGIKGQRWGVRRFQTQDGGLTAEGRKRYSLGETIHNYKVKKKRKAAAEKAREAKAAKAEHEKKAVAGKVNIKDMTDDEIRKAIARKQLENQYNALHPKQVSKGEAFVKGLMNDVIKPAATNAGKNFLTDYLNKLGKDVLKEPVDSNSLEGLKSTYDKLDYQKKIKNLKNDLKNIDDSDVAEYDKLKKEYDKLKIQKDIEDIKSGKSSEMDAWAEVAKKSDYEKKYFDTEKARREYEKNKAADAEEAARKEAAAKKAEDDAKAAAKKAEAEKEAAAKKAEAEKKAKAQKEKEEKDWSKAFDEELNSKKLSAKSEQKDDNETVTGEVQGEGKSTSKIKESMESGKNWWESKPEPTIPLPSKLSSDNIDFGKYIVDNYEDEKV